MYLLTRNLRTRRPTKKLDKVKVGPFFISKQISPVNFRLELPKDAKIHPVFHISLLEPADAKTPVQEDFYYQADGNNKWEVQKILRKRQGQLGNEYLVKWLGYPDSENTWEPETHLTNCQKLLRQFRNSQTRRYTQG